MGKAAAVAALHRRLENEGLMARVAGRAARAARAANGNGGLRPVGRERTRMGHLSERMVRSLLAPECEAEPEPDVVWHLAACPCCFAVVEYVLEVTQYGGLELWFPVRIPTKPATHSDRSRPHCRSVATSRAHG
jgi:hypothetical protein